MKANPVLVAALAAFLLPVAAHLPVAALAAPEPPVLAPRIAEGTLPPLAQRLPEQPLTVPFAELGLEPGRYGGSLRMLASVPMDIRMMGSSTGFSTFRPNMETFSFSLRRVSSYSFAFISLAMGGTLDARETPGISSLMQGAQSP